MILKLGIVAKASLPDFVNIDDAGEGRVQDMRQAFQDAVKLARVAAATFDPCEEVSALIGSMQQSLSLMIFHNRSC